MKYRRFGRTELQMPVISCGGMRYQFKWQDVEPQGHPAGQPGQPRGHHPPRARTGHQPHRDRARLRHVRDAAGRILPDAAAREDHRPDQGRARRPPPEEFLEHLRDFDEVSAAGSRGSAGAARHQQPRSCSTGRCSKGGCLEAARKLQKRGPRAGSSASPRTPRPDIILEAVEQRRVRLREPALVFRQRPELAGHRGRAPRGTWACSSSARTTRAANSTSRRTKLVELCAPLTPMQFNDLYCLARPQVHTLSCGAARPGDFDEHVAALEYYDRIAGDDCADRTAAARRRWSACSGADWCARWFEGLPQYVDVPGQINVLEILRLVDLRQVARPRGVGQDALQPARPGGPLVSRRERRESGGTGSGSELWRTARSPSAFPPSWRKRTRCCSKSRCSG